MKLERIIKIPFIWKKSLNVIQISNSHNLVRRGPSESTPLYEKGENVNILNFCNVFYT